MEEQPTNHTTRTSRQSGRISNLTLLISITVGLFSGLLGRVLWEFGMHFGPDGIYFIAWISFVVVVCAIAALCFRIGMDMVEGRISSGNTPEIDPPPAHPTKQPGTIAGASTASPVLINVYLHPPIPAGGDRVAPDGATIPPGGAGRDPEPIDAADTEIRGAGYRIRITTEQRRRPRPPDKE